MTDDLPTARTMAPTGFRVHVWCKACRQADLETLPEGRRRFAILNIPRHLFSEATGAAARRRANTRLQE